MLKIDLADGKTDSDKEKSLLKNSFIFGLGGVIAKAILFLLNPFYARVLGSTGYGVVSVLYSFSQLVTNIIPFGQQAAILRFYFDYSDEERRKSLSAIFNGWIVTGLVSVLIFIPVLFYLSPYLFEDLAFWPYILLAYITSFFWAIPFFAKSIYKAQEDAKKSSSIDVFEKSCLAVGVVTAIYVFNYDTIGWIYAFLLTGFFVGSLMLVLLYRTLWVHFDKKIFAKSLKYGLPLTLHIAAGWILSLSDRIIIGKLLDYSEVGYYTLAYTICQGLSVLSYSVSQAWSPRLFKRFETGEYFESEYNRVAILTFVMLSICILGISLLSEYLLFFLGGEEYINAQIVIPIVGSSFLIDLFYRFSTDRLHTLKKTKLIPAITISSAVVNLGLNFILIPIYGILGAAISTLVGYLILGISSSYIAEKYLTSGLEYKWLVTITAITLITSLFIIEYQIESLLLFLLSLSAVIGISYKVYTRYS